VGLVLVEDTLSFGVCCDLRGLQLLQHARRDFDECGVDDEILAVVGSEQRDKRIQHGLVFF
jgi:hypothetical protein